MGLYLCVFDSDDEEVERPKLAHTPTSTTSAIPLFRCGKGRGRFRLSGNNKSG